MATHGRSRAWGGRKLGPGGAWCPAAANLSYPGFWRRRTKRLPHGEPKDDGRFVAGFAHALEHAGAYAPEEATLVARTLLPEILSYDPTRPASFPDNGRTLTDDAADVFLAVLTNRKITEDKVGPHGDLLAEFPYLGPPHSG